MVEICVASRNIARKANRFNRGDRDAAHGSAKDPQSEETGTGTFNAANWAVWDASDLRDDFL